MAAAAHRWQPFLGLRDTENATGVELERLYRQSSAVSSIAYLLFSAAEPFAAAQGRAAAPLSLYMHMHVVVLLARAAGECGAACWLHPHPPCHVQAAQYHVHMPDARCHG